MNPVQPHTHPDEVQAFALSVGKAIQHYGAIEYLVNQLIAQLIADSLLTTTFTQLGISKRLTLLASLVERHRQPLSNQGWETGDLFKLAQAAFVERNKIAHNPWVIMESPTGDQVHSIVGIHVVKYNKAGTKEEWVQETQLKTYILTSRDLLLRFGQLLNCCKAINHLPPETAA